MRELRFTLVSDGPTDRALIPILRWLLQDLRGEAPLRHAHSEHFGGNLASRIHFASIAYPCDILFVHRDAENQDPDTRRDEIERAISTRKSRNMDVSSHVCVIPIRMTEAWLLFDEPAIRSAAGNPNGAIALDLPRPSEVENLPDPKNTLRELLIQASELKGRRRKKFNAGEAVRRVADFIVSFQPLRNLSAFRSLEVDLNRRLSEPQMRFIR